MKTNQITLLAFLICSTAQAQIAAVGTYTQNFDSLASTGTQERWSDNSTLPGWYSEKNGFSSPPFYYVRSGTNNVVGPVSYGSNSDRALGVASNEQNDTSFGVRFINSGTKPILGFSVSFDGEQWGRQANASPAPETLYFSYKVFSTGPGDNGLISDTGWIDVPALDFTSPNWTDSNQSSLDGNTDENRVPDISSLISGSSILVQPGQELWFRWVSYDGDGGDHFLAIDNLSVSFFTRPIPEPASISVLAGLGALSWVSLSRRRRN